jgi:hypothetical protein
MCKYTVVPARARARARARMTEKSAPATMKS